MPPGGFNPALFSLGQQFAAEPDGPPGQNLWDAPFQTPYAPPGMLAPGNVQPSAPGFPPFGGMPQGGDPFSQGPQMGPVDPNTPFAPLEPSQYPGMGQQQSSPKADINHPFWSQVGQYLGGDQFKDSILAGVIAGQMATNPQAALHMALQLKESRENRAFRAQQNQLQREAQLEARKQKQDDIKLAKATAAALSKNVDINEWVAREGPLTPDRTDDFTAWVTGKAAASEKAKLDLAERDKNVKAQNQVLKQAATAPISAKMWTDPASPKYNPEFAANLEAVNTARIGREEDKKTRETQMGELRKANTELAKMRTRLLAGAKTDAEKEDLQILFKELDVNMKLWQDAKNQADSVELFSGTNEDGTPQWAQAQQIYMTKTAAAAQAYNNAVDKINEIKERKGLKPLARTDEGTRESSAKAKSGFAFAYSRAQDESTRQSILQHWRAQFDDEPPIPKAP